MEIIMDLVATAAVLVVVYVKDLEFTIGQGRRSIRSIQGGVVSFLEEAGHLFWYGSNLVFSFFFFCSGA